MEWFGRLFHYLYTSDEWFDEALLICSIVVGLCIAGTVILAVVYVRDVLVQRWGRGR